MVESANTIRLININQKLIDFNQILDSSNSLYLKNCHDVRIILGDKINKITVENSNKILFVINKLIIGFDISKSNYILIKPQIIDSFSIPFIGLFKSTLFLIGNIENYSLTVVSLENSEIYNVDLINE